MNKISLNTKCLRYFGIILLKRRMSNVKILNVAEKNDVAKGISNILSNGRCSMRPTLSKYNKLYQFDHNILNRNATMLFTSVSGHLMNYDFFGNYKSWQSVDPVSLFDAPVIKKCSTEDYEKIKQTLEREIRGCSILIIWTDCDREGENIGYEVINVCQAIKQNIQIYRAHFSEITAQSIKRACQRLGPPDKKASDAVDVRQQLDLRIGAAYTRFQTLRLRSISASLANQVISYGSCQFPTLGFVVDRYNQVNNFIPEPFWKIKVTHTKDSDFVEFTWSRVRLFDRAAVVAIHAHCMDDPLAKVISIKSKPKSKWRPLPLDTVEFEKLAVRKLKMSAKEAMKIAEKLYTQGYISYPRTETNKFESINLASVVEQQVDDQNWGGFARRVLENGPNPRNGNKTDNAHPPIHPTKYPGHLERKEGQVYELITRHFLACCDKDAKGHETTVEISINDEKFSTEGLAILERNYLDVYPYEKWNAKIIPTYQQGETFNPDEIAVVDGQTSPPSLLTEADLISLMEKHGIGTDATHAEHIEKIKEREYVAVIDGKFVPRELGLALVKGYDKIGGLNMSKPFLRAELEADLKRICEGTRDPNVVLREQIGKYKEMFVKTVDEATKLDEAIRETMTDLAPPNAPPDDEQLPAAPVVNRMPPSKVAKCPNCGSDMVIRERKNCPGTNYLACQGFPNCKASVWLPTGCQVQVTNENCPDCASNDIHKLKFTFPRGTMPPKYYYDGHYIGCVGGCDPQIIQDLHCRSIKSFANLGFSDNVPDNRKNTNNARPQQPQVNARRPVNFQANQRGNIPAPMNRPPAPKNAGTGQENKQKRRCGHCRKEGHTKKTCPQLKQS